MVSTIETKKATLVHKAAALAGQLFDLADQAAANRFIAQFYEHVPPADVAERTPRDLYGAALSLWRFGERRRPGQAKIRVHNPDPAADGWSSPHTIVEIVNDDMPFLVDSVTGAINASNRVVHLIIHPILMVARGPDWAAVRHPGAGRCRDARILDANRDHIRSGSSGPRPVDPSLVGCPRRRPRRGDRLAADAAGLARGRSRIVGAATAGSHCRTRRSSRFSALARRRQLYVSRLPRIFFRWRSSTRIRAARYSARRGPPGLRGSSGSRLIAPRSSGFCPPPRTAGHHQIKPPRDGSPDRSHGCDRSAALRRKRRRHRRSRLPRLLYVPSLQPQFPLDPAAAAQGPQDRRALRSVAGEP